MSSCIIRCWLTIVALGIKRNRTICANCANRPVVRLRRRGTVCIPECLATARKLGTVPAGLQRQTLNREKKQPADWTTGCCSLTSRFKKDISVTSEQTKAGVDNVSQVYGSFKRYHLTLPNISFRVPSKIKNRQSFYRIRTWWGWNAIN